MRIGIWSESYEPLLNGVAVSISTLRGELVRTGHEVCVFAPRYPGYEDADPAVVRFPSFVTPADRSYPLPFPFMPGLERRVRDMKLDIMHTQIPWTLGWIGLRMGRRLGVPVVSTNHTQYVEYAHYVPVIPASLTRRAIAGSLRAYYNRCDAVIVPSSPIAGMLAGYGVVRPVHPIATGLSIDTARRPEARRRIRAELGIGEGIRVVLYVGRLAREKNVGLLLESFEVLSRALPGLRLLVVGGGPHEEELRRQAAGFSCDSSIMFVGPVPRDRVVDFYSAADVFAFPSSTDTQGLVLCEALASGLPCVAVRAGGSPEMITEGVDGFLCAPYIPDFSSALRRLLSDGDVLRSFSARAVANAARFSSENMARQVMGVYESVLLPRVDAGASSLKL